MPELYISKGEKVDHKAYNDKIYKLDKPFVTKKKHWLVIGNSFGRDFANVILESRIADSIELSYIYIDNFSKPEYAERYKTADRIFLSSLGTNEELVSKVESICLANNFPIRNLVIVGTKNFGENNGQFYVKRGSQDYYNQRTRMEGLYYKETNDRLKNKYGNRYLDIIGLVIDKNGTMPVFTPDHHFVSQDCRHFSKGGAKWFATLIDWSKYIE